MTIRQVIHNGPAQANELVAKLADGETGMTTLGETLKSLEERTNLDGVNADVKEVLEIVKAVAGRTKVDDLP